VGLSSSEVKGGVGLKRKMKGAGRIRRKLTRAGFITYPLRTAFGWGGGTALGQLMATWTTPAMDVGKDMR